MFVEHWNDGPIRNLMTLGQATRLVLSVIKHVRRKIF